MTIKKLSAAAIAALTTLALAACGGGIEPDESTSPTPSDPLDTTSWGTSDDIRTALNQIDGCDDYAENDDGSHQCWGERHGYTFTIDSENPRKTAAGLFSDAVSESHRGDMGVVYGDGWTIAVVGIMDSDSAVDNVTDHLSGWQGFEYRTRGV
ncbi:hypothetical protein [Corynebacterium kalidii]